MIVKSISGNTSAEAITQHLIPKIIRERYPDLTEGEVEEVRQRVILDTLIKGNDIVDKDGNPIDITSIGEADSEQPSEGNRLLKLTNRFINIDKLSINLVDTINPFQRAYEIVSKNVDASTLKIIQDTIAEQKYDMPIELAITLFKGPLKEWVASHNNQYPSLDSNDPKEKELACAFQMIKNQKIREMMGLEYEPKGN
jgi:hypothetical protein